MKKIEPYTNEQMTFDEKTNQYFLTLETVKANLPGTITDDGILAYRIKKNTRVIYNYIFNHAHSANRNFITNCINHTEEYRKWLYDALMAQMEADLFNGYNDLGLQPAQSLDERALQIEQQITVDTQMVLYSSVGYGGINLMAAFPISGLVLER